jgi:CRP-like cAMP-binding protein
LTKGNNATATGVMMNAKTSFSVDPKTYKPPTNLKSPTGEQKKLLLNVLANNVLFTNSTDKDTTTPQLKDALIRAFEAVKIRKGETVEEALRASGSQHHDDNCLYVIEEGEMELNDERGNVVATAVAGDTFGELHTILQPHTVGGKVSERRKEMRAACDSKIYRLSHNDFRGIMQSQTKQDDIDKVEILKKLPFLSKLMFARDVDKKKGVKNRNHTASDAVDKIGSILKPIYFYKGEELKCINNETLYVIKEGQVKLTSDQNKQFVLGPGNHIGRKALMGTQGNEPTVKTLEAVTDGSAYAVEKHVADMVLGNNFVNRETSRLDDASKCCLCRSVVPFGRMVLTSNH